MKDVILRGTYKMCMNSHHLDHELSEEKEIAEVEEEMEED
jgi:hypothetical protein